MQVKPLVKLYEVEPGQWYAYPVEARQDDCKRGRGEVLAVISGCEASAKRIVREEVGELSGIVVPFFIGGTFRV